jgi:hypothetical protein
VALGGFSGAAPHWIAMSVPGAVAVWLLGIIAGFLFGLEARLVGEARPDNE